MSKRERKTEKELYDPHTVDALLNGDPITDASYADMAAAVQKLTAKGFDAIEISGKLGIPDRKVFRLRLRSVAPYPDMMARYDIHERRARDLERVVDTGMSLAMEMRHDPTMAWLILRDMSHQELLEMTMALACMVDVDRSANALLGWVVESSLAQVIPIRQEA